MKLNRRVFVLTTTAALVLSTNMSFASEALDRVMEAGLLKVATSTDWAGNTDYCRTDLLMYDDGSRSNPEPHRTPLPHQ